MPIIEILKYIALSFLPIGVLFIIINGIIRTMNVKIRAVINLIIGSSLFLIFMGAWIIDFIKDQSLKVKLYLSFPASILIITTGVSIYLFTIAKRYNYRFPRTIRNVNIRVEKSDEKDTFTPPAHNKYVYLVFQYNDNILLENKDGVTRGFTRRVKEKLPKDTTIKFIEDNNLKVSEIKYVGRATRNLDIYYCYLINLTMDASMPFLSKNNKYYLDNNLIDGFDKEIILRTLIGESFAINNEEGRNDESSFNS